VRLLIANKNTPRRFAQVWYSAAWSNSTLAAFRAAVSELLAAAQPTGAAAGSPRPPPHPSAAALAQPPVARLLRHWQAAHVPLAAARSGWLASQTNSWAVVANFRRKADRLALCSLVLTGEVPQLGPADVGSPAMFQLPAEFGDRALNECFLQARARAQGRARRAATHRGPVSCSWLFAGLAGWAQRTAPGFLACCVYVRTHVRRCRTSPLAQTLPHLPLLRGCAERPGAGDVVAEGVRMLRHRVTALALMLRAGLVRPQVRARALTPPACKPYQTASDSAVEASQASPPATQSAPAASPPPKVHLGDVGPSEAGTIAAIRALKPYTMVRFWGVATSALPPPANCLTHRPKGPRPVSPQKAPHPPEA
jgi:hypothetical protein